MPKKPPSGFDAGGISTLEEKKQLGIAILEITALPARLFMRSHVGYQRLSLIKIYIVFGLLMLCNTIGNAQVGIPFVGMIGARAQSESLRNFAFVFLAWAIITRRERYKEFKGGIVRHGYDGGTSHFEFLAPYVRREWIYRFVDPLAALATGYLVHALGFGGLGGVLLVSATSFGLIESVAHSQAEEALWAQRNNGLDAEVLADMASTGQSAATSSPAQAASFYSTKETHAGAGLPTGADDTLADAIHARKKASGAEEPRESTTASKDNGQAARQLLASWLEALSRLPMAIKAGIVAAAIVLLALVFSAQHHTVRPETYIATVAPAPVATPVASSVPTPAYSMPAANAPAAMTSATPSSTATVPALAALVGFWQGSGELPPARGACTLKFELRSDPAKDGDFLGYSSLACGPPMSAMFGKSKLTLMEAMAMQHGLNPESAILHGTSTASDAAIGFEVSKTIGVGQGAVCAMTSASLTPFGVGQVSFDWKETGIGCNGGQMLLARARQ